MPQKPLPVATRVSTKSKVLIGVAASALVFLLAYGFGFIPSLGEPEEPSPSGELRGFLGESETGEEVSETEEALNSCLRSCEVGMLMCDGIEQEEDRNACREKYEGCFKSCSTPPDAGSTDTTGIDTASSTPDTPPTPPTPPTATTSYAPRYEMSSTTLQDIWIDPVRGSDENTGENRDRQALRSIAAAWNRIPEGNLTRTGYRILLTPGEYDAGEMTFSGRHGTREFPIIWQAADGPRTVTITSALDMQDISYLYLIDLDIISNPAGYGGGNLIHLSSLAPVTDRNSCNHILLRNLRVIDRTGAQETIKVNQCQHIYIEDSEISGGMVAGIDYVAVQYGHIVRSRFPGRAEWCIYLKGGTANLRIEENDISGCTVGGFSAGNTTGFDYMVPPWINYEAYNLRFVNNVVHDIPGHGLAVFGGYNILFAHNTFYRVSDASHPLLTVNYGGRPCENNEDYAPGNCARYNRLGGWGISSLRREDVDWIPNRHVYIYNNIFYQPAAPADAYAHFSIRGPISPPASTNIPRPTRADADLRIAGNIIWNGPPELSLGLDDGACRDLTCNEEQLRRDNMINITEPRLRDPERGDLRLTTESARSFRATVSIPAFPGTDPPSRLLPESELTNTIERTRDGALRDASSLPGAY